MRTTFHATDAAGQFPIPSGRGLVLSPTALHAVDRLANAGNINLITYGRPGVYPVRLFLGGKPEPIIISGPNLYRFAAPWDNARVESDASYELWRLTLLDEGEVLWPAPLERRPGEPVGFYFDDVPVWSLPSGDNWGFPLRGLAGWTLALRSDNAPTFEVDVVTQVLYSPTSNLAEWGVAETLLVEGNRAVFYRENHDHGLRARIYFRPKTAGAHVWASFTPLYRG